MEAAVSKTRVLLAVGATVVRQSLRQILETDAGIEIVAEVDDGPAAVESAERLRPSVAVVDVGLPGLNGVEVACEITTRADGVSVLILSRHSEDVYVRQGLKAGAKGYLLKDSEDVDLLRAVRALAQGGSYFSPSVSRVLLAGYLSEPGAPDGEDAFSRLTGREREVLQLVSEGKTNKEIAQILSLSVNTVESHRKHVMGKLDLHNTAEIVRFAMRQGLVD